MSEISSSSSSISKTVNIDPESDRERDELREQLAHAQRKIETLELINPYELGGQLAHANKKIETMKGIIEAQAKNIADLMDRLEMAEKLMQLLRESKEKVVSLLQPKTESKASQANIEIVTAAAKAVAGKRTSKKWKDKGIQAPIMAKDFYMTKNTQTYIGRKHRSTQCEDSEASQDHEQRIAYGRALEYFYDTDDGF